MTWDLLVFDLDGVLVDSEGLLARVWSRLLAERDIVLSPEQLIRRFVGQTDMSMAAVIAAETGRDLGDAGLSEIRTAARAILTRDLQAVAGAAEALSALSGPRCICSNSQPDRIRQSLEITGLKGYFDDHAVFSAADVARPKPHPDIHFHAAARFDVSPDAMVVVEDSVTGVTAAVKAGCRVIGFTGASHILDGQAEALRDAGAGWIAEHMADLPGVIEKI